VNLSTRSLLLPLTFLLLGAAVAALVYNVSLRAGLDQLQRTAQARLAQSNDRFLGQVTRFQQLVNSLARHPRVNQAATGTPDNEITELLLEFALAAGAGDVFLVNRAGRVIASSDYRTPTQPGRIGDSLDTADYISTALGGGLGWFHGIEDSPEPRILYFSRAVFSADGPVIGAVVVSVSVDALEFEWSFGQEPVAYFDQAGVIFVTNRPQLALLHDPNLVLPGIRAIQFDTVALPKIFDYRETTLFSHRIWRGIDSDRCLARLLSRCLVSAVGSPISAAAHLQNASPPRRLPKRSLSYVLKNAPASCVKPKSNSSPPVASALWARCPPGSAMN